MLKWWRKNKEAEVKIEQAIIKNDETLKDLNKRIDTMTKAVMDGESQWMLVKCPPQEQPVCEPKPEGKPLCLPT